jgi:ribonuclease HI
MKPGGLVPPPDILDDGALTIYVDGSKYESPRRGGKGVHFAWVDDRGDEQTWDADLPATTGATNNEMELEAPIDALSLVRRGVVPVDLARFDKLVIRTDSMYVFRNLPNAISTWRKTKWTKKVRAAVLHSRNGKRLISEMKSIHDHQRLLVRVEWSPGKKGRHAKIVDKLAKQSANSPASARTPPNLVRRKVSDREVDPGSVKLTGQTMTVRIIHVQYLPPPHRRSRYKYEVADKESPFHGYVDWAESELHLKPGHSYLVRMNDQQENPRIEELLNEVVEDLTPYLSALKALGQPSTAQLIADQLTLMTGVAMTSAALKRRIDQLVESGQIWPTRSKRAGRPYVYALAEAPAEWHGDA